MAKAHPDRRAFHRAIRKHIKDLVASGITRRQLQEALSVTKQAISSYVGGRTTPKPYILRRLLSRWPSNEIAYRGMHVDAADFDIPLPTLKTVPSQGQLFDLLSLIRPEDLKIDVDKTADSHVELNYKGVDSDFWLRRAHTGIATVARWTSSIRTPCGVIPWPQNHVMVDLVASVRCVFDPMKLREAGRRTSSKSLRAYSLPASRQRAPAAALPH